MRDKQGKKKTLIAIGVDAYICSRFLLSALCLFVSVSFYLSVFLSLPY